MYDGGNQITTSIDLLPSTDDWCRVDGRDLSQAGFWLSWYIEETSSDLKPKFKPYDVHLMNRARHLCCARLGVQYGGS